MAATDQKTEKPEQQTRSARELLNGASLSSVRSDDGLKREFFFERGSVDSKARTAVLSFSSEFPVRRRDFSGREFFEVLDHEHVDMGRMNGAPLLYGHDRRDHLGTVTASAIGPDKRGRAIVKFSRSIFAQEKLQDVEDEILTKTSVGYDLGGAEYVVDGEREGIPIYRFRNWAPYEVTLCPIPADPSVGVGRSAKSDTTAATTAATTKHRTSMSESLGGGGTAAASTNENRTQVSVVNDANAVRQQIKDVNAAVRTMSEKYPAHAEAIRNLGSKCLETGDGMDAFNRTLVNDILGTKQDLAPVRQGNAEVGLNAKQRKRYSIGRAIRLLADGKPLDGIERECNDELQKKLGREPKGFFLPDEVIMDARAAGRRTIVGANGERTLTAGVPADGGYTVDQTILANELVTLLRNQTKVVGLGARVIGGLIGDISIPRQLTGAAAYWVAEGGTITQSGATFGQIVGKPRRIGTSVPYSKQFIAQTSLDAESFVVNDSDEAIAVDIDRVAIRGAGGAEPLGILNVASGDLAGTVTFSGAATYAKYLEFFQKVAEANALLGSPKYLTTPASAVKAMSIAKFSNGTEGIWDTSGKIGMFGADWSNQFPSSGTLNQVVFGDWTQALILEWAGRDVVVDPYSGKKEGTVEITIQRLVDLVYRRLKSFVRSTDTGAA